MQRLGKWRQQSLAKVGFGYAGLALLWLGVSGGLKVMEQTGCVFDLPAIIKCKVLTIALVWIGRFGWFPRRRLRPGAKLGCGFLGLLLAGPGMIRVTQQFTWVYWMLVGADTLIWAGLLTVLLETLIAVYYRRGMMTAPHPSQISEQWRLFWTESLKLGLWLALLLGLIFFYLVSFYRFEVYFYSRMMTAVWIGAELLFYGLAAWRLTSEVQTKIALLEREISGYLGWRHEETAELISQWLPVLQYLVLSRNYLISLKRPMISVWTVSGYLALIGFLLGLPQLIGSVIKV
jgi:hypothetical protein